MLSQEFGLDSPCGCGGLGFDAGVALDVWPGALAVLPEHPVTRESFL